MTSDNDPNRPADKVTDTIRWDVPPFAEYLIKKYENENSAVNGAD